MLGSINKLTLDPFFFNFFMILFNNFEFTSSGSNKKYSTNISETVQVNDFLLNSKNKISKLGINHNFKSIIKNVNSDGKNSSKFKQSNQSEILSMISYDYLEASSLYILFTLCTSSGILK